MFIKTTFKDKKIKKNSKLIALKRNLNLSFLALQKLPVISGEK